MHRKPLGQALQLRFEEGDPGPSHVAGEILDDGAGHLAPCGRISLLPCGELRILAQDPLRSAGHPCFEVSFEPLDNVCDEGNDRADAIMKDALISLEPTR